MTIYSTAQEAVFNGKKFSIDLKKRSLKVDGKFLIKDGEYEGELYDEDDSIAMDDIYPMLDESFYHYQHSVPSERSESKGRLYFRALKEKDLLDEDMLYGMPREIAQFELEMRVLICILDNKLVWDNNKWFWQSERYKDFIILKEWVVGE